MLSDFAIEVRDLSKCYHIYDKPSDRLMQMLTRGRKRFHREFWALKDVSFRVGKGETVGIIGRNGSGKSTLLQLICGTLNPTSGSIQTNGRIAALLELGSGFNPEFTGRENIRLNATVLGLNDKAINERFDSIVDFADIGDFLDQPVKTYSSGMAVRLAFAVIAHVNADILVVDEALSVGDVFFQQKCMRFLRGFQTKGGSIVFVSHDTASVLSLCSQAILLYANRDRPLLRGDAESVCKQYLEDLYSDPGRGKNLSSTEQPDVVQDKRFFAAYEADKTIETVFSISGFRDRTEDFGLRGAKIYDAGFFDRSGARARILNGGDTVRFVIKAEIYRQIFFPAFGFMFKNKLGEFIYTEGTDLFFRSHSPGFADQL